MSLRLSKSDTRAKAAAATPRSSGKPSYPPRTSTYNNNSGSNEDSAEEEKKRILANRYKTKLCKNHVASGSCPYEVRCMFAHGEEELRTAEQNVADGLTTEEAIKEFQHRNNTTTTTSNGHHHNGHHNSRTSNSNGGRFAGRRGTFTSAGAATRPFNSRAEETKTAAAADAIVVDGSNASSTAAAADALTSSSNSSNHNNVAAAAATCAAEAENVEVEEVSHDHVNGEHYYFTFRHNPYAIDILAPEDRLYTYSNEAAAYYGYSTTNYYYGGANEEEGMWMDDVAMQQQQQQPEYFPVEMVPNGSAADLTTPMATSNSYTAVDEAHLCGGHGGCTAAEFDYSHHHAGADAMIVEP